MLRVASDPSDKPRLLDELYPGGDFVVVAWDKCVECDRDVDAYVYVAGNRRGYCSEHYVRNPLHAQ